MRKNKGFTIIEIIVVIIVISILAAVALPRFLDLTDDAKLSSARNAAVSLSTGINLGKSQYLLMRLDENMADLDGDGIVDLSFSAEGYPTGANVGGGVQPFYTSPQACVSFWNILMESSGVTVSTDSNTEPDFLATGVDGVGCQYDFYAEGNNREICDYRIIYTQDTGRVSMQNCRTSADIHL